MTLTLAIMAVRLVVCSVLLCMFVAISSGTECRANQLVELSANSKAKFIYSPNYPEPYPPFTNCKWRIRIESQSRNKIIQVRTVDMDLTSAGNTTCNENYIQAYDGQYSSAPMIKQWCDDSTIVSTGPYMIVEFHSGHLPSRGFALAFHEVSMFSHNCLVGDVQKIDVTQTPLVFTFPNTQVLRNGSGVCDWLFTSSKMASKIIVELDGWTIPPGFCDHAYISFHDGPDAESLEILRYCHSDQPFHRLMTSYDKLFIRLHGNWEERSDVMPSIKLKLHTKKVKNPMVNCQTNLQTNVITSIPTYMVYPNGGESDEDPACPVQFWSSDPSQSVRVDVVTSSLDQSVTCQDYLDVYKSTKDDSSLDVSCLDDIPYYLNSQHLIIKNMTVPADENQTLAGQLVLKAYTVGLPCNGLVMEHWAENDKKNKLQLFQDQQLYTNDGYCKYLLKAEKSDEKIKLYVNGSFYGWNKEISKCETDYIDLYDGSNETAPMIGRWCGGHVIDGFHSTGHTMLIVFRSDQQGRQINTKYDLQYLTYKEMCSKFIIPLNATSSKQNMTSPGYPDYYPPESLCRWTIHPSTPGHMVMFNITASNMGLHCKTMVTVYKDENSEEDETKGILLGRVCEKETPSFQTSEGSLQVVFRSYKYWNVGGFEAEYWEEPVPEPTEEIKVEPIPKPSEDDPKANPNADPKANPNVDPSTYQVVNPENSSNQFYIGYVTVLFYNIFIYVFITST